MIFDELATTTKDMQDLQRKISIQKNQDQRGRRLPVVHQPQHGR